MPRGECLSTTGQQGHTRLPRTIQAKRSAATSDGHPKERPGLEELALTWAFVVSR